MSGFRAVGHELIRKTPFTLLALTRHPVEPHERDWFARCRADYLRSFPLSLLEALRLGLLLCLVGPATSLPFTLLVWIGWMWFMVAQFAVRRSERAADCDQETSLRRRAVIIVARALGWSVVLAWGLMIAPEASLQGLVAMAVVMMVIDGIGVLSLPHLALASCLGSGVALLFGLLVREGAGAAPVAVAVLVLASFLHWSIYNLYYLFATRRIRTRRLVESNETIRLLLNQYDEEGSDWLFECDIAGLIVDPSARFCAAAGRTAAELETMTLADLFIPTPELAEGVKRGILGEPGRNKVHALEINGERAWWSVSVRSVYDRAGKMTGWRGFISDVTRTRIAEEKVAYMAHYDLLTDLPNRTLFNATLDRAIGRVSEDGTACLLFIDLDHFKDVNDTHGHEAGDRVLVEVSRRLEKVVRAGDMVTRLGGDEFAVLLSTLPSREAALQIGHRILELLSQPITVNGQAMPIGASIGAAFAPEHGETTETLLRAADLAMYEAKTGGRNGISVFDASMERRMTERRELEVGLRHAIKRGEMALHYQTQIDLDSGEACGVEALLRWNHPQRGMIMPTDFIPLAEETGMIVEIGEWVIRQAIADAAAWPDHLAVAVNVSPVQIGDGRLVSVVTHALAASGVAPRRLELEITESVLIKNAEKVLDQLNALRALGVRITLDDFGTGYSSLNYLRTFPFDKIKIDRSFVDELTKRGDCDAIVQSVISLANDLNIVTTAEGVESGEQLRILRERGCTQVQGYLFSRAVPSGELAFAPDDGGTKAAGAMVSEFPERQGKPEAKPRSDAA